MDFNFDKILERRTIQVPVGDKMLNLRPLSAARHTEFGAIVRQLDIQALVDAVAPIVDGIAVGADGSMWSAVVKHGPELARLALDLVGVKGGELITSAAEAALDNEENHDMLARLFGEEGKVEREFGVYITSKPLRVWVRHSITLAQALHVVGEAAKLTGYAEMGKALVGLVTGALKGRTGVILPEPDLKGPAVPRVNSQKKG